MWQPLKRPPQNDLEKLSGSERLEKLLQRFPVEATTLEGWCSKHNLKMKEHHKDGRKWYAHKVGSTWCYGK